MGTFLKPIRREFCPNGDTEPTVIVAFICRWKSSNASLAQREESALLAVEPSTATWPLSVLSNMMKKHKAKVR